MAEALTETAKTKDDATVGLLVEEATREISGVNDCPITPQLEVSANAADDSSSQSFSRSLLVDADQSIILEERVKELETKLATLSLLISQQRIRRVSPLHITPPPSPPEPSDVAQSHPALDSPAPLRPSPITDRKRNLSFQILHGDASSTDRIESDGNSIFLPQTLQPKTRLSGPERLAAFLNQQYPSSVKEEEAAITKEVENSTPKNGVKKDIKNKWLTYLNSFQESNYDVDLQMEEFVKIPGAVEALLGFGFWICVDSFLYVLTVLPIRFLWSLLLLMRYMFIWIFRHEVPEGPFRFHRRYVYAILLTRLNNCIWTLSYLVVLFFVLPCCSLRQTLIPAHSSHNHLFSIQICSPTNQHWKAISLDPRPIDDQIICCYCNDRSL